MTLRRNCLAGIVLAILLAPPATRTTTLARMSLEELAAAADVVARVQCLGNESRWESGEIWTFTLFDIVETIKGSVPRLITVRLLGGQVGHLISTVDGVPHFQPGEEAILFLEGTRAGDFAVTGWVQGTFRIRREAHTRRERVTQDSSAVAVFDPATRQFRAADIRNLPLEQFKQRLLQTLERQQSGRQP